MADDFDARSFLRQKQARLAAGRPPQGLLSVHTGHGRLTANSSPLLGKRAHPTAAHAQRNVSLKARQEARSSEANARELPSGVHDSRASQSRTASQQSTPYMRHRLREKSKFWATFCTSALVMRWILHGFPLLFNSNGPPLPRAAPNHASASQHSDFVDAQIEELLAAGTIEPWPGPGRPTVVTPLGVVVQNGKRRLIFDGRYLNDHLNIPKFKYEDLSHCGDYLKPDDWIVTTDLSKGFHHITMAEESWEYMGIAWRDKYYVYTGMPFGLATAPWAFTKVFRQLLNKWKKEGHRCSGYIDDQLHANQCPEALEAFVANKLLPDMEACGLVVNLLKSNLLPRHVQIYLGVQIDTRAGTLTTTMKKKTAILRLVQEVLDQARACPKRLAQQVVGHLMAARWGFGHLSRLMTLSIHADMNAQPNSDVVSLSQLAISDLVFWRDNFDKWDGINKIWPVFSQTIHVFTDAAGKSHGTLGGWGGWTTHTSTGDIIAAHGVWDTQEAEDSSTKMELKAIHHTLESLNRKGGLSYKDVKVFTDNQGAFFNINKGGSRTPAVHEECRKLLWYCIHNRINLHAHWIPRDRNTLAD